MLKKLQILAITKKSLVLVIGFFSFAGLTVGLAYLILNEPRYKYLSQIKTPTLKSYDNEEILNFVYVNLPEKWQFNKHTHTLFRYMSNGNSIPQVKIELDRVALEVNEKLINNLLHQRNHAEKELGNQKFNDQILTTVHYQATMDLYNVQRNNPDILKFSEIMVERKSRNPLTVLLFFSFWGFACGTCICWLIYSSENITN